MLRPESSRRYVIVMSTWFIPTLKISRGDRDCLASLSVYANRVSMIGASRPIMRRWHQWLGWMLGESDASTTWASYCRSMLAFNFGMFAIVYGVLSFQDYLPLNPDKKVG